jgi:hypothetical protein
MVKHILKNAKNTRMKLLFFGLINKTKNKIRLEKKKGKERKKFRKEKEKK